MDVSQTCIAVQSGDKVHSHGCKAVTKVPCREEGVSRNPVGNLHQALILRYYCNEIPLSEIDAVFLKELLRRRQGSRQDHTVMGLHIRHADGVDLQAVPHGSRHTGPIESRAGSAFAGLLKE